MNLCRLLDDLIVSWCRCGESDDEAKTRIIARARVESYVAELESEVGRLRSEVTTLRLYAPARRAQPTVKTAPLREPNYAFFGLVIETDEEWAERAGRQITEVVE